MLCTSGFTDNVMFSYRGSNGQNQAGRCLENVRQVAVPVGRQLATAVFGRVRQNAAPGAKSAIHDCHVSSEVNRTVLNRTFAANVRALFKFLTQCGRLS